MRRSSSRALPAVALVAGLATLALAGRLLPTEPGARPPISGAEPPGSIAAPPVTDAPQIPVPNAVGASLARATAVLRGLGLRGVAGVGDPQRPDAIVIAQEPAAGALVDAGGVIGLRTSVDVVPNGTARRVRLGPDRPLAVYLVEAPDPARHALTVAVAVPRRTDVEVHLEPGLGQLPLMVLSGVEDADGCQPAGGQVRCVARFGPLRTPRAGRWIVAVAKRSPAPATIAATVTVTFRPL